VKTGHGLAITLENNIFFPTKVNFNNPDHLHWLLHELAHVEQYKKMSQPIFLATYVAQAAGEATSTVFSKHGDISLEDRAKAYRDAKMAYLDNRARGSGSAFD
jgi:hypothetical protein